MIYIEVILPLPVGNTFTYTVPDEFANGIDIGMRTVVPFGNKKMYTGIVSLIHTFTPQLPYEPKHIFYFPDSKPILRHPQLKFWQWISDYYQSYLGDVYRAAVPSGLKLESETQVKINPHYNGDYAFSDKELLLLDALSDGKTITVNELNRITEINNTLSQLKILLEKGAVEINEELTERFRPKTETYIRLTDFAKIGNHLKQIFDKLEKAEKQLELLMKYIELSKYMQSGGYKEISKKELLDKSGISPGVLSGLIEKNVLETYRKEIGRLENSVLETQEIYSLNDIQQQAMNKIQTELKNRNVALLHGITSSGKTEIYIHLIKKTLDINKQALFLVPEIALTTQLTTRLKRVFGNKLGVYHSKFSDAERVEIWNKMLSSDGYDVILGVRSSIFLPFRELGLIIVDEEHEPTYKQFDPAPRYHARDAAIMLALMHSAKTILGTATPSIESYYNAQNEKYAYIAVNKRFQEIELPEIKVVNIKELHRRKEMEGHFSPLLIEKTRAALEKKKQILLFQNRRGYAPFLECKTCSFIPKCKNCDVTLTLHKYLNKLTCHYCGYTENIPTVCPACHTPNLENRGFGTEKIEDEIKSIFPNASVARMDTDTTRNKKSHDRIITDFEQGKIDILVGTQMISKGLDFEKVSLVGILNADNMLNFPDFRAAERAFQLMVQVSGRAGRKNARGTVLLQTHNPQHSVIEQIVTNNYELMFQTQLNERKQFKYPPFVRLIEITLRHKEAQKVNEAADKLSIALRKIFGNRIYGPNIPLIARIQNMFIKQILIKIEPKISTRQSKEILRNQIDELLAEKTYRNVRINLDIDPL